MIIAADEPPQAMKPFSELLSEYVERVGVSDAELARRLGVSRQTIFRWREGTTHSPRHRPDVVRLAQALRLTPEERDQLLLAAGFRPEGQVQPPAGDELVAGPSPQGAGESIGAGGPAARGAAQPAPRLRLGWIALGAFALATALLLVTGWWREAAGLIGLEIRSAGAEPEPASPGESLVLVARFANYSGGGIGFNVQDRLAEALQVEFAEAGLGATRVELLGESFASPRQAAEVAERLGADFVLWGEYDSGRVIAFLTGPGPSESSLADEQRWLISNLEQLSATINLELPQEVSWMGLYGVGLAHFRSGRDAQAEAALSRALQDPPDDPLTVSGVYFVLGVIEGRAPEPDLDRVIALYTEALELSPGLVSAWNNRGASYLARRASGDLERAEADFRRAMELAPDFAAAPFNLALAISQRPDPDLDEILQLLRRAEALNPGNIQLQNSLCWYLSLDGRPEQALPHCELAIELDDSGYSNDSYGLALALVGRNREAAAEFAVFLEKLEQEDLEAYRSFLPSRSSWIERLNAGENPFDASALQALLVGAYEP